MTSTSFFANTLLVDASPSLNELEAGPTAWRRTATTPTAPLESLYEQDVPADLVDSLAATGDARVTPVIIRTPDGVQLRGHWHLPAQDRLIRFATVIHPATAVPASYYHAFADWLTSRGHAVLTYDYRGIGQSIADLPADASVTMDDWATHDAGAASDLVFSRYPDLPVYMVGHSMGGQAMMMNPMSQRMTAGVFYGVGSGYWGFCEGTTRASRLAVWHLMFPATLGLFGRVPGWTGIGEDLPSAVAWQWRQRCLTPTYFEAPMLERVRHNLEAGARPVLSIAMSDDDYINPAAVAVFAQHFSPSQLELRNLTPADIGQRSVGHFRAFRPSVGQKLWPIMAQWLESHR
jgi:predicted alpha/beta hydrolase